MNSSHTSPSNSAAQRSSLGAIIRRQREKAGLSQRELAARAGCHNSYLSRLESGDNDKPTPEVLQGIAQALELEPGKLLRFIGVKPTTVLPTPRVYFRRAYGMTADEADEAAARVKSILQELRDHKQQGQAKRGAKKTRGGTKL
jgi:transcriptional regulator with XRE-family HTH domain